MKANSTIEERLIHANSIIISFKDNSSRILDIKDGVLIPDFYFQQACGGKVNYLGKDETGRLEFIIKIENFEAVRDSPDFIR